MSKYNKIAWITVSHPGMSIEDTIGDMIRLKTIKKVLENQGWKVLILTYKDKKRINSVKGSASMPEKAKDNNLKKLIPKAIWYTIKDVNYILNNRRFYNYLNSIKNERPHLIIDYNFYFNNAASRYARRQGITMILNFESFIEDSMVNINSSFLRGYGKYYEQKKYNKAREIWTVSKPLSDKLLKLVKDSGVKVRVMPNAVNLEGDIQEVETTRNKNKIVVGFVGGLSPWYSIDKLMEACYELIKEVPNIHLLVVGDGPEKDSLKQQLSDYALKDWLTFTGRVPHEQVSSLISQFDVGVITNHKWWTSPLKLLEYGALGKAVIAPRISSISSMVSEEDVLFFQEGDFHDFKSKLLHLLHNKTLRINLGSRLKRKVEESYSLNAMSVNIGEAIRSMHIDFDKSKNKNQA